MMGNEHKKTKKYYVRVFLKGPDSDKYLTLGPYMEDFAVKMARNYLSTGVCSWIEEA